MRWYCTTYWRALKFGAISGCKAFVFVVRHERNHWIAAQAYKAHRSARFHEQQMNLAYDARVNEMLREHGINPTAERSAAGITAAGKQPAQTEETDQ